MDGRYKTYSVLRRSILSDYVFGGSFDTSECVNCFNNEVYEALRLYPVDILLPRRHETLRAFILKVLIYVGVVPGRFSYGLVAKMIERLSLHPGTEVSDLIDEIAEKTNSTVLSVTHNIDSIFDVNNSMIYDRVTTLTKSKPLTARDMLVDIAQYVSYSILVGDAAHARTFRQ